jgi:ubiquinone/menaquinone biosynthesis C-methylase UbiE
MGEARSNLHFKLMALTYKVRDFFFPRIDVLKEVGIQCGFRVLDYGCGTSSYVLPLAGLVGNPGEIYALDIHPLAIKMVQGMASKRGLTNVRTIQSDCNTGLPDRSIDVALLYDTFHDLSQPNDVLQELHRILKPTGVLSFSDHHMKDEDVLLKVTAGNLFKLSRRGRKTYSFEKAR